MIGCEMVGTHLDPEEQRYTDEPVSLSLIDFFTGEVLVKPIVEPMRPVLDWRGRYTGMSEGLMREAVADGDCLKGWPEARVKVWEFVDDEMILLGHTVSANLMVLRMVHVHVVDLAILVQDIADLGSFDKGMSKGLPALCRELLGLGIRRGKKTANDPLEDVLATREAVMWCMENPRLVETWALEKKYKVPDHT